MCWSAIGVALAFFVPAMAQTHGFTSLHMPQVDVGNVYPKSILHGEYYSGQVTLPSLEEIRHLNVTNGTFLPLDQIQGDIFWNEEADRTLLLLHHQGYKNVQARPRQRDIPAHYHDFPTHLPYLQPKAMLNVAWSSKGLRKLGVVVANVTNVDIPPTPLDEAFNKGQASDACALGDNEPSKNWVPGLRKNEIDGAFLIASNEWAPIADLLAQILGALGAAIEEVHRLKAAHRPGHFAGHEHFGFLDGISQPAVSGFSTTVLPGQSLVPPGIILTGELGDPRAASRPSWMKWGSFLAFRQLQQFVPEFDEFLLQTALTIQDARRNVTERADLLGARMFGRWKSGAPTDLYPDVDDPGAGSDPNRNNDFDFNHPLPFLITTNQSYCPFSAHTRKLRPRADQANANVMNQIIRAGSPYGDEVTDAEKASKTTMHERGFAFVSYQSNIENGFRFQQVMWANNVNFPVGKSDPTPGYDPIIGQNGANPVFSSGIDYTDLDHDLIFKSFVLSRGGEYLYSPSMAAILDPIAA